jgi:hypothetical protein
MSAPNRRPPRIWVCTVAANDRNAGKLLSWIAGIARHATQRRRGHQGLWNANSREYILTQTGLSLKQYRADPDRAWPGRISRRWVRRQAHDPDASDPPTHVDFGGCRKLPPDKGNHRGKGPTGGPIQYP